MNPDEIDKIRERYLPGQCTSAERKHMEVPLHNLTEDALKLSDQELHAAAERLNKRAHEIPFAKKDSLKIRQKISVAAATVLISVGVFFWYNRIGMDNVYREDPISMIKPGHNKAMLTTGSGNTIVLSEAKTGIIIGTSTLKYNDGTEVDPGNLQGTEQTTISTPNGGTYQITLLDGSKVWLNAASSLTYSTSLNERGEDRIVTLSGEAYFEIFKDKKRPFIVKTKLQEVEVLGTHFNINAYADENVVKTTLVEGSVKVTHLSLKGSLSGGERTIVPKQQAVITVNNPIKVEEVDVNTAIAWKNGEFSFRNEPLESIMRKIARWYNVEVVYENKELANIPFGGSISRFGKVSEVLFMLQQTGKAKFKIEGRRITVN